jgi:hypothetical protein
MAWLGAAARARGCSHPVRLRGSSTTVDAKTGEIVGRFDSADLPDSMLYMPCGTRRAAVCPACAETYRQDTYQLLKAGLAGGKGVPDDVKAHPAVFVTLTAPTFGPVHTRPTGRDSRVLPCRPRRDRPHCRHGKPLFCTRRHGEDEKTLGAPLCLDCYDHDAQVVWNLHAPELWRRTVNTLIRALDGLIGKHAPIRVRLSYAKVAEYQARGVIHFHALIRLDGRHPDDPDVILPPPAGLGIDELRDAIQSAASSTGFRTDTHPANPGGWLIGWGSQGADIQVIRRGLPGEVNDEQVAGYLAKYATKSTEATGLVAYKITPDTIDAYAGRETHPSRLIGACWRLGHPRTGADWPRLRRWAHMLGFGGHFSTRSRRYSTTLKNLRQARQTWRRNTVTGAELAAATPSDNDQVDDETTLVINHWSFAGTGWRTTEDAELAAMAADSARARRPLRRDDDR